MSLVQYRYFVEVLKARSIRKAADRLEVTPSSISRHIQQLEHELGLPLLERSKQGVSPTPAGKLCMSYVQSILFDIEALKSELEGFKTLRRGNIKISTIEGVVEDTLCPTISMFQKQFGGVTFELEVAGAEVVAQSVISGDADIGIAFRGDRHPDIEMLLRAPDPLAAIVSPNHVFAKSKSLTFKNCLSCPIAAPETSFGIRKLIDQTCSENELEFKPVLLTNSIEALRSFARTGGGISILPNITILRELEEKSLVSIPITDPQMKIATTDVMVRRNRRLPIAASEFVKMLVEQFETSIERSKDYP